MEKVITEDMLIGDILDMDSSLAPIFIEMGMHCLGCPSARGESLKQACEVHGIDVSDILKKINSSDR
jgi:hybrid cluster-associated redox disulfide protein